MIQNQHARIDNRLGRNLIINRRYDLDTPESLIIKSLSPIAQATLLRHVPAAVDPHPSAAQPEVITLRLLDFLTSRKGYVQRKGQNLRTAGFYEQMFNRIIPAVRAGRRLTFSTLCLSPSWANASLVGHSPYPHMAAYLSLENFHKIAAGIQRLYKPGAEFILGYEGFLFEKYYFHNELVLAQALEIFQELNRIAHEAVNAGQRPSPVTIMDGREMAAEAFGDYNTFVMLVKEQEQHIDPAALQDWQAWYKDTNAATFFPNPTSREKIAVAASRWREAVQHLKHRGGRYGKGMIGFQEGAIPFTPAGRRDNMLPLQFVPGSPYMPHQRAIIYHTAENRWSMAAYDTLERSAESYEPRFVPKYGYPFYYEKQA